MRDGRCKRVRHYGVGVLLTAMMLAEQSSEGECIANVPAANVANMRHLAYYSKEVRGTYRLVRRFGRGIGVHLASP